jgi:multicomponent Na+:H+ antiporter subunit D
LFHLFNHSVFKSLLFLNSGSIEQATGTRDLRRMGGLGRRMPVTGSTTLVASLSIAGMPPFNGFWSKLLIILAAVEAGRYGLAAFAVVASLLTLASFAKVMKFAFMGDQSERWNSVREAPAMMRVSMILMALICLFGGSMLLPAIGDLTLYAASDVLAGFAGTAGIVFPGDLP